MTSARMFPLLFVGILFPLISSAQIQPVKHRIDTHIHFYDTTRNIEMRWPPQSDTVLYQPHLPAEYSSTAKAAGVTGVVIVEASDHLEDNDWILDLVKNDPFYLGLVGNIDLHRPDFREQVLRLKKDPRFVGIRPRSPQGIDYTEEAVLGHLRFLAEQNLTMDFLTNGGGIPGIQRIAQVAQEIPNLTIVVNHCLGYDFHGEPPSPDWISAVASLAKHDKVYVKISGLYQRSVPQPAPQTINHYQSALDVLWNHFGQDRLIYGSNWPVTKRTGTYLSFLTLVDQFFREKGQDAREAYYWANAAAAYRLPLE